MQAEAARARRARRVGLSAPWISPPKVAYGEAAASPETPGWSRPLRLPLLRKMPLGHDPPAKGGQSPSADADATDDPCRQAPCGALPVKITQLEMRFRALCHHPHSASALNAPPSRSSAAERENYDLPYPYPSLPAARVPAQSQSIKVKTLL